MSKISDVLNRKKEDHFQISHIEVTEKEVIDNKELDELNDTLDIITDILIEQEKQEIILVNLTPHPIHIYDKNEKLIKEIEPEKETARVDIKTSKIKDLQYEGHVITLFDTEFGKPVNVPEFKENTYYIVSRILKTSLPDRTDLIVPLGDVRDSEGKVTGCTGFSY